MSNEAIGEFVKRLNERAISCDYEMGDPHSAHTADLLRSAATTLSAQEEQIERLTKALQYADTLLFFDLRKMREFGPDFNQAVLDTGNRVRAALEGSKR